MTLHHSAIIACKTSLPHFVVWHEAYYRLLLHATWSIVRNGCNSLYLS